MDLNDKGICDFFDKNFKNMVNGENMLMYLLPLNPSLSLVYLNQLNKEKIRDYIVNLNDLLVNFNYNGKFLYDNIQWMLYCLSEYFGNKMEIDVDLIVAKMFLSKHQKFERLSSYIRNRNSIDINQIELILQLLDDSPSFFRLFQKLDLPIFHEVDKFDYFVNKHGFIKAFNFIKVDNMIGYFNDFAAEHGFSLFDLFSQQYFYENNEFGQAFQKTYYKENSFTKVTPNEKNYLLSLINYSIALHKHIFDVIFENSLKEIKKRVTSVSPQSNGYRCLGLVESDFNDLLYLILALFFDSCKDEIRISQNLFKIFRGEIDKISSGNGFHSILRRVDNDLTIIDEYSNVHGRILSLEELVQHSVPFHFKRIFQSDSYDVFHKLFSNNNMFSFTEKEVSVDYDFVRYYFTLWYFLKYIEEDNIEVLGNVNTLVASISNDEIRSKLLLDVFSLLFLKKNADEYVCSIEQVKSSLAFLASLSNMSHAKIKDLINENNIHLLSILSMNQSIKDSDSIGDVLVGVENLFYFAIKSREWQTAENLSQDNSKMLHTCNLFRVMDYIKDDPLAFENYLLGNVTNYRVSKLLRDDPHLMHIIQIEFALSFEGQQNVFDNLLSNRIEDELLSVLLEKRYKYVNGTDLIEDIEFVSDIGEQIKNLNFECSLCMSYNYPLLNTFYNYLQKIKEILSNVELKIDFFRNDPMKLLRLVILQGDIEAASSLSELFGYNIYEAAILFLSDVQDVMKKVFKDHPVVFMTNDINNEEIVKDHQIVANYNKHNNVVFTDSDMSHQEGMSQNSLIEHLNRLLFGNDANFDEVCELSYRIDPSKFETIINEQLYHVDIIEFEKSMKYALISESLYNKISILAEAKRLNCSTYPLKKCISDIIRAKEYDLFRRFLDTFTSGVNVFEVVKGEFIDLLSRRENIHLVLNACPESLRSNIISSLSSVNKYDIDERNADFYNSIPSDWTIKSDILQTIKANLKSSDLPNIMKRFTGIDIDFHLKLILENEIKNPNLTANDISCILWNFLHSYYECFRSHFDIVELFIRIIRSCFTLCSNKDASTLKSLRALTKKLPKLFKTTEQQNDCIDTLVANIEYMFVISKSHFVSSFDSLDRVFKFCDFKSVEEMYILFTKLAKHDYTSIVKSIAKEYNIDVSNIMNSYAINTLELGFIDEPSKLFQFNERDTDFNDKIFDIIRFKFKKLSLFSHALVSEIQYCGLQSKPIIDLYLKELKKQNELSEPRMPPKYAKRRSKVSSAEYGNSYKKILNSANDPIPKSSSASLVSNISQGILESDFYNATPHFLCRIVKICNRELRTVVSQQYIESLKRFIHELAPIPQKIQLYTDEMDIEKALDVICGIKSIDEQWSFFFDLFLNILMQHDTHHRNSIKCMLSKIPEGNITMNSLLEKLLQKSRELSLKYIEFEISVYQKNTDDVVSTAKHLLENAKLSGEYIYCIDMIQDSLERATICNSALPFLEGVIFQKKFCDLDMTDDISMFNIFGSYGSKVSIIKLLFKVRHFKDAFKAIEYTKINFLDIASSLGDILINEDYNYMYSFIKELENFSIFEKFLFSLLNRLIIIDFYSVKKIIEVLAEPDLQIKFYLHFGCVDKAYEVSKRYKRCEFYPVIANIAYQNNDKATFKNAVCLLEDKND